MLNLAEYRNKSDRLADHLPWAALVAPGVVLNKDGSFQRSLRFRGPDLESATESTDRRLRAREQRAAPAGFRPALVLGPSAGRARLLYSEFRISHPAVDEERARTRGRRTLGRDNQTRARALRNSHILTLYGAARPRCAGRTLVENEGEQKRDWRHEWTPLSR